MTQPDLINRFEQMLASGKETALLRFSLGNEYLKRGEPARAAEHLQRAVELDPKYSAAWKILGKALADADRKSSTHSLPTGRESAVADEKGDKQAAKEMSVFARRIEKQLAGGA